MKDTIEREIEQLPDLKELLENEPAAENDGESIAPNVVLSNGELVSIRDVQSALDPPTANTNAIDLEACIEEESGEQPA